MVCTSPLTIPYTLTINEMAYRKALILILTMVSLLAMATGGPQKEKPRNMLRTNKLDTLMLAERFNLRVNGLGWLMLSPNVGVEMTLGSHNWNRWTIGISGRGMWATTGWNTPSLVHDMKEARAEVRCYKHSRELLRSWFVGGWFGYADFDLKVGHTGYRGDGFTGGLTAGTITPLYGYRNGSSIDLEFSTNLGLIFAGFEEYVRSADKIRYEVTRQRENRLLTAIVPYTLLCDVLRVSFVYHIGPSVADRYRRRISIDQQYRTLQNELSLRRDSMEQARQLLREQRRDSLELMDYERRFEKQRLELEKKHQRDSLEQVELRKRNEK